MRIGKGITEFYSKQSAVSREKKFNDNYYVKKVPIYEKKNFVLTGLTPILAIGAIILSKILFKKKGG